jgi:hypothetical protein
MFGVVPAFGSGSKTPGGAGTHTTVPVTPTEWPMQSVGQLFSSVQFLRGPSTLTPPPSQRTAPLPSVNTSTEYSLARATQFR